MPVVLHLNDTRISRVGWRLSAGRSFTVVLPEQSLSLSTKAWRLCLVVADGPLVWDRSGDRLVADSDPVRRSIVAVGRIRGSGRVSSTDDRYKIADPAMIEPAIALREVVETVSADVRDEATEAVRADVADAKGRVSEKLIQAVIEVRPAVAATVQRLRRMVDEPTPVDGPTGETLTLERDAVRLALSIAGADTDALADWQPPTTPGGFLPGLGYEPHEDVLLAYDAARFPNWSVLPSDRPDWLVFGDGTSHIRVGSVNNTSLENTLGVDLIYRHVEANTFVLVQYKRMSKDAKNRWFYRPDSQMRDQLQRMRKVYHPSGPASPRTWRLHSNGFVVKLVRQPTAFDPRSDQLLSGIYLPLEYLTELLGDACTLTDRGARRLGYDNIDRYLTTGLFVSLVRQGWIGTTGLTTQAIELIIEAALGSQRMVVIAEESSEQTGAARRRSDGGASSS
ncbi:hypothetical protein [Virgisporangium aurantiacum]|uniref:Uncharacterized protein n=1 Tax=Virgisporangium aurantiacum TaxID=175570 RepID=A0A8J3ZKC0_9ACTN|nr:hypothetical protein [Virgisporangium aurantiacum]GIJ63081.1 hypothetical protein Vau01_105970 [Virgisporangium aurantiacum]